MWRAARHKHVLHRCPNTLGHPELKGEKKTKVPGASAGSQGAPTMSCEWSSDWRWLCRSCRMVTPSCSAWRAIFRVSPIRVDVAASRPVDDSSRSRWPCCTQGKASQCTRAHRRQGAWAKRMPTGKRGCQETKEHVVRNAGALQTLGLLQVMRVNCRRRVEQQDTQVHCR